MKHAQAVVSQSLSLVFSTLALWPWMIAVPSQLSEQGFMGYPSHFLGICTEARSRRIMENMKYERIMSSSQHMFPTL